jgi:hypothetical protein
VAKPKHLRSRSDNRHAVEAAVVAPRLLPRQPSANYISVSVSMFDALRARGEIPPPILIPAAHRDGHSRIPLWDLKDLDATIERWKHGGKQ